MGAFTKVAVHHLNRERGKKWRKAERKSERKAEMEEMVPDPDPGLLRG